MSRLDRRVLLRVLAPGALVGVVMGTWLLVSTFSTSWPVLWWLGGLGAIGLMLGSSAFGMLVWLLRQRKGPSALEAARALGWSAWRLFGIAPVTIVVVWVPVLVVETDLLVRLHALTISFGLAAMGLTAVNAWVRWQYATSVVDPT